MAPHSVHCSIWGRRLRLPLGAALAVPLVGAAVVAGACTGGSGAAAMQGILGPFCAPTPCEPGTTCTLPAESNCNGEWYCWADRAWYCAPPESGPPPDVAAFGDDGGSDAADGAPGDASIDAIGSAEAAEEG